MRCAWKILCLVGFTLCITAIVQHGMEDSHVFWHAIWGGGAAVWGGMFIDSLGSSK